MITITSAELHTWIAMLLWPLTRILGLIVAAPLFGNISVPGRVKIGLGIMLTLLIAPAVPAVPALDPASLPGLLILAQQLVIGIAMGFAMRIVFVAVEMAGEIASLTMGLGFASFFDPQSRSRSSSVTQFLSLLALMLFIATNMHLVLLATLAESFTSIPISPEPLNSMGLRELADWGGRIFSAGVQLSLPIVAVLLVTNAALGILSRAAPQLNLFGIGFPVTVGVGFIMLAVVLPYLAVPLGSLFQEGIDRLVSVTQALAQPPR